MEKSELLKIASNWILPNGDIIIVPNEDHENYLPDEYDTMAKAESKCVKFSCGWGYTAPISKIFLPDVLTTQQAQRLVEIEEGISLHLNETYFKSIKDMICDMNYITWDEILNMK